jgi:hypothetical protein
VCDPHKDTDDKHRHRKERDDDQQSEFDVEVNVEANEIREGGQQVVAVGQDRNGVSLYGLSS